MTVPRISVLMPVYNCERYPGAAARSILEQNFSDFGLIAVNDGSTDGSGAVLDALAAEDARILVIQQENGGVTKALNTAIAAARGVYMARMDGDDIAFPERFAQQVVALDARPELVALGTTFQLIDPQGRLLRHFEVPLSHAEIDQQHRSGLGRSMICHPTVMMRSSAVRDVGGYDETFSSAQDVDLFLRLGEVGELANLETALLSYRMHAKSIGYTRRDAQKQNAWNAARKAAERRGTDFETAAPTADASAHHLDDIFRKWGWWALSGGNAATARHYAFKAIRTKPFSKENWWLALIALRGY